MGATFPNGIASFKQHRDNIDDVSAADINKIQDEVVAMEETLGAALTSLQIVEQQVTVLNTEEQQNQQVEQQLIQSFSTLKDMIAALWDGKNIYAAHTSVSNIGIGATAAVRPYPPYLIPMYAPDADSDPMQMWNGSGFTLKKDGFWVAQGEVQFNLAGTGAKSNDNFGTYEGSITVNGENWIRGLDRRYPVLDQAWHDVILHPTLAGWFPAGTNLTLRAAQSSALTQNIASARFSVYRLRGR